MHVLQFAILFLLAMLAGGWMATTVVFARGYVRMSAAAYIEAEQTNSAIACKYFAPSIVLTVVLSVIYLLLAKSHSTVFILTAIGAGLLALTAVFVKVKILPINDEIHSWSPQQPPAHWKALRERWVRYHNLRTIFGVVAFSLQAIAVVWR
jgi:uncharacterized membrane protein YagU involved in acid resistance